MLTSRAVRMRAHRLLALPLLAVAVACPATDHPALDPAPPHDVAIDPAPAAPVDWHGRSIYFVVTDRFANGDPSNDGANGYPSNPSDPRTWHGGDFQGLIDRLDYIAGMGFTGLWITPVIEQHDARAYHGYYGWDWSRVDAHLGDVAKLQELIANAHARGIAVMIDTVANHTGPYNYASPSFPDLAMYHHNGRISDFNDHTQLENNDLSGLNDLAQEQPAVRDKLIDHARWLAGLGAEGLRIDTVKHVPQAFWRDYVAATEVFTLGEVLSGSVDEVAPYSHVLDATLDYPLYFALRDVFANGGSARQLGAVLANDGAYVDPRLAGVFVDNHDQRRFLCDGDDLELRLALAFALTTRGIPIVYYGTEQGFASCTDNRADLFAAADPTSSMYRYIRQLHDLRAATPALRNGVQRECWQDDAAYAFEREDGASAAVVAFNLSTAARTLQLQLHTAPGTVLHDALGNATATVGAGGKLAVMIPARSVVILTNSTETH